MRNVRREGRGRILQRAVWRTREDSCTVARQVRWKEMALNQNRACHVKSIGAEDNLDCAEIARWDRC